MEKSRGVRMKKILERRFAAATGPWYGEGRGNRIEGLDFRKMNREIKVNLADPSCEPSDEQWRKLLEEVRKTVVAKRKKVDAAFFAELEQSLRRSPERNEQGS